MSRRTRTQFAVLWSVLLVSGAAPSLVFADEQDDGPSVETDSLSSDHAQVELTFRSGECVRREHLVVGVDRMLGRRVFIEGRDPDLRVDGDDVQERGHRVIRFSLADREGRLLGRRDLRRSNADCAGLGEEAVVVLALLVDLRRRDVTLLSAATDAASPAPPAEDATSQPSRHGPFGAGVALGAALDARALPSVAAGPLVEAWLSTPWSLDLRFSGEWLIPQEEVDTAGRGLSLWFAALSLGPCVHGTFSGLLLGGCAAVELDIFGASALDLADGIDKAMRLAGAARLTALASYAFGPVVLRLHMGLAASFGRMRFIRDQGRPEEALLHEVDRLGAVAALSVGFRVGR